MITFKTLYSGREEDDHGHTPFLGLEGQTSSSLQDDGIGHGHLGPDSLVFFAAYRLEEDLGLGGHQGRC